GLVRRGTMGRCRADVVDGLSNTLLAGDKAMNRAHLGGPQGDDDQGYTASWDEDTLRRTTLAPVPDTTDPGLYVGHQFGSSHGGGLHAVLADGAVRFVPYSVNPAAFAALGTVAGGEVGPEE